MQVELLIRTTGQQTVGSRVEKMLKKVGLKVTKKQIGPPLMKSLGKK